MDSGRAVSVVGEGRIVENNWGSVNAEIPGYDPEI